MYRGFSIMLETQALHPLEGQSYGHETSLMDLMATH